MADFHFTARTNVRINDVVTQLSPLEANAVVGLALLGLDAMGGDVKTVHADLMDQNMSWFDQADLVRDLKISTMAARGLMTFLNRKGLAQDMEAGKKPSQLRNTEDGKVVPHWALTDHGINVAAALMGGKQNNVGDYVLTIPTES